MKKAPVPINYFSCLHEEKEEEHDEEILHDDDDDDDDACENGVDENSCGGSCVHSCRRGIGRVPASLLMRDGPKPKNTNRHERRMDAWQNSSMKAEVDRIGRSGMEVGIDIAKFDKSTWTGMRYKVVATDEEAGALRAEELRTKQKRQVTNNVWKTISIKKSNWW